jgi:hypothetical protein
VGLVSPLSLGERAILEGGDELIGGNGEHAVHEGNIQRLVHRGINLHFAIPTLQFAMIPRYRLQNAKQEMQIANSAGLIGVLLRSSAAATRQI